MVCLGAAAGLIGMSTDVGDQLEAAMQRGYVAAYRLLGNPDESRDACQEAAARAWSARERYDSAQPFYPWFYRILKNHCLDRLKLRRRVVSSDRELSLPQPIEKAESGESLALEGERARAVARAVAALSEDLREIIELRHFQDASYDEIAEILDCPIGTVMSRLYRARKALRNKLIADRAWSPNGSVGGARR